MSPGAPPPQNEEQARAVAVDLGATSARYASGHIVNGQMEFHVHEQIRHEPIERDGRLTWDLDALRSLCDRAFEYAQREGASFGIASWAVDHAFVDRCGELVQPVVCYRDPSHQRVFEAHAAARPELFRLTGIQHQPFNTIYQLIARRDEDPSLPERSRWFLLPDYLLSRFGAPLAYEATNASTTQLVGLDGLWSQRAFDIAGWPAPDQQPVTPGGAWRRDGVRVVRVASHDTASAVLGIGHLAPADAYLNLGTWALLGRILDEPVSTSEAEEAGFTNERAHDGRIRFLANIPGFYIAERLHEELRVSADMSAWLSSAAWSGATADLAKQEFFNPKSMVDTLSAGLTAAPTTDSEWAGCFIASLAATVRQKLEILDQLARRPTSALWVGGGGSRSKVLCDALACATGLPLQIGAAEATLVGNLRMQLEAAAN